MLLGSFQRVPGSKGTSGASTSSGTGIACAAVHKKGQFADESGRASLFTHSVLKYSLSVFSGPSTIHGPRNGVGVCTVPQFSTRSPALIHHLY